MLSAAESARILGIFPTPSISHQIVYHALMKDLAKRGHQLTILTPDVMEIDNLNVTQIDLHDSYEIFRKHMNFSNFKKSDESDFFKVVFTMLYKVLASHLSNVEVQKLITKSDSLKFDLIIIEHFGFSPFLAFAEIYDCPVIGITSMEASFIVHEQFGNGGNPVIHPDMNFAFIHGALTFAERWQSLRFYLKFKFYMRRQYQEEIERMTQQNFPSVKASTHDMIDRVQFLMINTHPVMGFVRPLLPNTIQLGFMHIEAPKALPSGEVKTFIDNSKNGVIYMSLGSNVLSKNLSPEILQIILKVFGSLKFDVLWKFEVDNLPNKPNNVLISKWLPQYDVLAHPKLKLFITQGGQQSMEEAIDRAVPMIVIPFVADQHVNAKRMKGLGIALIVDLTNFTEINFLSTINETLKPVFRQNIEKLRDLVQDQPMSSRERAVWWTEYVIRHKGANHLQYRGRTVPFYQKYWLDFIGIASLVVGAIAVAFYFISRKILSSVLSLRKLKKE